MQLYQPRPTTSARITISRPDCRTPRARQPGVPLRGRPSFSAWLDIGARQVGSYLSLTVLHSNLIGHF